MPPIILLYYDATGVAEGVHITWGATMELFTTGFNIYRAPAPDPATMPDDEDFVQLTNVGDNGFIPTTGSIQGGDYTAVDDSALPGQPYWYRLVVLYDDATAHILDTQRAHPGAPHYFPTLLRP